MKKKQIHTNVFVMFVNVLCHSWNVNLYKRYYTQLKVKHP